MTQSIITETIQNQCQQIVSSCRDQIYKYKLPVYSSICQKMQPQPIKQRDSFPNSQNQFSPQISQSHDQILKGHMHHCINSNSDPNRSLQSEKGENNSTLNKGFFQESVHNSSNNNSGISMDNQQLPSQRKQKNSKMLNFLTKEEEDNVEENKDNEDDQPIPCSDDQQDNQEISNVEGGQKEIKTKATNLQENYAEFQDDRRQQKFSESDAYNEDQLSNIYYNGIEDNELQEQPKKIQTRQYRSSNRPSYSPKKVSHPHTQEHCVQPKILLSIFLLFKQQIKVFCRPQDCVISIKPNREKNKILLFYSSQEKMEEIDDRLSDLIDQINVEQIPTPQLIRGERPEFFHSKKLFQKLKDRNLGIIRCAVPNTSDGRGKSQFGYSISNLGYFLTGKIKQQELKVYVNEIRALSFRKFTLRRFQDTRSHRLILKRIFDSVNFHKNFLESYQIVDLQIIELYGFKSVNNKDYSNFCQDDEADELKNIKVLSSVKNSARFSIKSNQLDLKQFIPAMQKFIRNNFGIFVLVYRPLVNDQFRSGEKYLKKIQVKGFQFQFVNEYKKDSRDRFPTIQKQKHKNSMSHIFQSYIYVFFQKTASGIGSQQSKKNLISALKSLNVRFTGARTFRKFPSIDTIAVFENEKYYRQGYPKVPKNQIKEQGKKWKEVYSDYIFPKIYHQDNKRNKEKRKQYVEKMTKISEQPSKEEQLRQNSDNTRQIKNQVEQNQILLEKKDIKSKEEDKDSQSNSSNFEESDNEESSSTKPVQANKLEEINAKVHEIDAKVEQTSPTIQKAQQYTSSAQQIQYLKSKQQKSTSSVFDIEEFIMKIEFLSQQTLKS